MSLGNMGVSTIRSAGKKNKNSRTGASDRTMMSLCYGLFIDAQMPIALSPWYAYASHRFEGVLTSLRNLLGAAVRVDLQVEGAACC